MAISGRAHEEVERTSRILALVPVLNEAGTIEAVIRESYATGVVDWLMVIDDGSWDGTADKLEALRSEYPSLDIVRRSERGLGTALHTGFRLALERYPFDRVVTLDADLSHEPAKIPELLSRNADLVLGSRYSNGGTIQEWPFVRRAISFSANFAARHLVGLPEKDLTTGFRVYRRDLVERIVRDAACGGYEFQIETIWLAQTHGHSVSEVPIRFMERKSGRSKLATVDEGLRFARFVAVKAAHRLWRRIGLPARSSA